MLKKILIVIIGIAILFGGVVAYFYLFGKKDATTNEPVFSLGDIFPFVDDGGNTPSTKPDEQIPEPTTPAEPSEPTEPARPPRLRMVNKGPISGAVAFDVTRELPPKFDINNKPLPIETEPATKIRYIETATGHVSETYLDTISITKLTDTTIPRIVEAYFGGKNANQALLRYEGERNSIQTFTGSIPIIANKDGTPDTTLRGSYLAENIMSMAVSPDRDKIFTVVKNDSGSVGTISLPDGTKKNQIFSLAFSEWLAEWPSTKFVTITTKPSADVPGYSYSIDITTKIVKKVLGNVNGLTVLTSPDMKTVLFSRSNNNTITTSLYGTTTKTVLPLPGGLTFPEKCAWQTATILYCAIPSYIPSGKYPDDWYQGSVSFVDQIYRIDTKALSSSVVATPSSVSASIDAINLSFDPSNTFLIFLNKKDGALWSLDLRP